MAKKLKLTKVGKPGDGKVVVLDHRLTIPDDRLAWLERRGYHVERREYSPDHFLILSPYCSWWADDMWDMLEAVVKLREKEAANG